MIIQWFLYGCLFIFCLFDYYQTVALIRCGYTEANPIVIWIIQNENWKLLLGYKLFMLILLGVLLLVNQLKNRRVK